MAQITNFKDRITDYAGSLVIEDDEALKQYTLDACQEIVKALSMKKPNDLYKFTVQSNLITSGDPVDVMNLKHIGAAVRDSVQATEGNALTAINYKDEGSIYFSSSRDPKYWVSNGALYIAPDPTPTEPAYYLYVPEFEITNFSSGVTKVLDVDSGTQTFPQKYYEALILGCAIKVLNRRLNDYLEEDEDIELVNGIQAQIARVEKDYTKTLGLQ